MDVRGEGYPIHPDAALNALARGLAQVGPQSTGGAGVGLDLAAFLVGAAIHAPSVHNSQPWVFAHRADGSIELWADQDRALPAADPTGREMVISCGAALATLALGVRWLGYRPRVHRRPDPAHPTLLARVALGPAYPTSALELELFAAVLDRHTHRGPFAPVPVPPSLLAWLRRVASRTGCRLTVVGADRQLRRVVKLTVLAQRIQWQQPAVQAELRRWLRQRGAEQRDGLVVEDTDAGPGRLGPRWAAPHGEDTPAATSPATAAGPADGPATGTAGCILPTTGPAVAARPPATILLSTADDDITAWLRAGETLQQVLLHAARHGVHASICTQPLEVRSTRLRLARLAGVQHPQMLLQLGYADIVTGAPRRPPEQVLTAR